MKRLFIPLLLLFSTATGAHLNRRPKQIVNAVGLGHRFYGEGNHPANESNYFKLLAADGDSLLVGARSDSLCALLPMTVQIAEGRGWIITVDSHQNLLDYRGHFRNAVYNLSLSTLRVHHKIEWHAPGDVIEECLMKGKSKADCQNYIRVLARQSSGKSLVCGTHAFAPKCREYVYDGTDLRNRRQFDGVGISPYDPRDNSSALFLPDSNEIYTGTVSDFVGNDPLIYRKKIDSERDVGLRTSRADARVLDGPNFVGTFAFKEHVYFFYREWASEALDNNEERQIYARVSRVCRNDRGGARPANERWTSFIKARLNCSVPTSTPFYFNELKSVSEPIPSGADHLIYAVFATPDSVLRMSAVCSFSMKKIREEFDYGTFKHQRSASSVWEAYSRHDIPKPRPGSCVPDSTKLPEATVTFATRNPLLHRAVDSLGPPLLIEGADRPDLTQIAVLPSVEAVSGMKFDVIYLGTSDGRVLKMIETGGNTTVIESTQVFSKANPVVNLLTIKSQVVVVSPEEIASISVERCEQANSCGRCVALQDPHCAWDLSVARCVTRDSWKGGNFIQNVVFGQSEQCPEGVMVHDDVPEEEVPLERSTMRTSNISNASLILACALTALVALIVGAFCGHQFGRSRALAEQHHSASSTSGSDYDSFGRARLTRHDSLTTAAKIEHVYGGPPKASMDATSLVMAMPPVMSASTHGSGINTPSRDKNAIMTSLNQNTLPRDYKVKKVYL